MSEAATGQAEVETPIPEGEWELAQSFSGWAEATVACSVLRAHGFRAELQNAHFAQANLLLAPAAGGIRLVVPASQVPGSRELLRQWKAGELDVDGPPPSADEGKTAVPAPLFGADLSAFLGFWLTPAYSVTLHWLNARRVGEPTMLAQARVAFWTLSLLTLAVLLVLVLGLASPRILGVLPVCTIVWYLVVGHRHSQALLRTYGVGYARRAQWPGALALGLVLHGAPRVLAA
jgi:hypothetical protein